MMKHIRVQLAFRKESRRVASKMRGLFRCPAVIFECLGFNGSREPEMAEAVGAEKGRASVNVMLRRSSCVWLSLLD